MLPAQAEQLITEQPTLTEAGMYLQFTFLRGNTLYKGDVAIGLESEDGSWLVACEYPNDIQIRTVLWMKKLMKPSRLPLNA